MMAGQQGPDSMNEDALTARLQRTRLPSQLRRKTLGRNRQMS